MCGYKVKRTFPKTNTAYQMSGHLLEHPFYSLDQWFTTGFRGEVMVRAFSF